MYLCIWLPAFAYSPHFIDLSVDALLKDTVSPCFPRVRSLYPLIERPRVICVFLRLFLRGRKSFKKTILVEVESRNWSRDADYMICCYWRRIQNCTNLCLKEGVPSACGGRRRLVQFWSFVPTLGYFDGRAVVTGKRPGFLLRRQLY